jgi:hypothetical protein
MSDKNSSNNEAWYELLKSAPQKQLDDPEVNAEVVGQTAWVSSPWSHKPEHKETIKFFYSDNVAKLKIPVANTFREIEVEYSSAEHDNDALLHLLFGKTVG